MAIRGLGCLAALCSSFSAAAVPLTIPYQLTHSQNMDPSPNPDGKRLVFISSIAGKEQLFTMNADASAAIQITRDDADHEDPAWSPDMRYLVFRRMLGEMNSEVFIADGDGSNVRLVANTEGRATVPRWSPDGKIIYFTNCTAKDYGSD